MAVTFTQILAIYESTRKATTVTATNVIIKENLLYADRVSIGDHDNNSFDAEIFYSNSLLHVRCNFFHAIC